MKNIGFIGLGKLGLPCAEVMAVKGHWLTGYDTAHITSKHINIVDSIQKCVKDKDIVFIAVPTPHSKEYDGSIPSSHLPPKDFDYSIVKSCIIEANKYMNDSQLLVLISTVLPGTTRNQFIELIDNTNYIYNPYLIAMGTVAWDMVNPEMVLIGTSDGNENGDARTLVDFYKTMMENNPRYEIGTWDECECIKIFYNTFISAKIGIVNMIQDVAERQGNIDVDVVTTALAKSSMRITGPQYMTAGMGDGGACHPRDNIALRHMADTLNLDYDLFAAIMEARDIQAKNMAMMLIYKSEGLQIIIHGKAYKPGVPYLDGSYSLLVGHYCEELGMIPKYIDPLTGDMDTPTSPCIFLLAHSLSITYGQTDELYCVIPDGSIVIDPWRKYVNDKCKVIHYGNTRNRDV